MATRHPTPEALYSALDPDGDPTVRDHVAECTDCQSTSARLRNGRKLIEFGRAYDPQLDWSRLESRLANEAESVTSELRARRAKTPPRVRLRSVVFAGATVTLAAAAAVMYVAELPRPTAPSHVAVTTHTAPQTVRPSIDSETSSVNAPVLLSAGGASVLASDGTSVSLSGITLLAEGVTLTTQDHGRAVISPRPEWVVDLRARTRVRLAHLRQRETLIALDQGELRVEPSSVDLTNTPENQGDSGVRLSAGRWSVTAHGATVFRAGVSTLRVVVLSGHATFETRGEEAMQVTGPVIFDLPESAGAPVSVRETPGDPEAIALSALSAVGDFIALPSLSPLATLTFSNGGALPSALEALRVAGPTVLHARDGGHDFQLELRPGHVLRWNPVQVSVTAARPVVTAAARPATVATVPPSREANTEVSARLRAWSSSAVRRIGHCFTRCRETNRCPDTSGYIELVVNPGREPVSVGAIDPAFGAVRTCVEQQAPTLPRPDVSEPHTVRIPISGGSSQR